MERKTYRIKFEEVLISELKEGELFIVIESPADAEVANALENGKRIYRANLKDSNDETNLLLSDYAGLLMRTPNVN